MLPSNRTNQANSKEKKQSLKTPGVEKPEIVVTTKKEGLQEQQFLKINEFSRHDSAEKIVEKLDASISLPRRSEAAFSKNVTHHQTASTPKSPLLLTKQ